MSPKQRNMLFGEWGKCWSAIVQRNGAASAADERTARMAVARKAIGRPVASWSEITRQKDIDWLLAVMFGISRGGDFNAQLRQVNQPVTRMEASAYAQAMLDAIGVEPAGREAYIDGVCRRIHKKPLLEIDDEEWRAVLVALNHTRMHKTGEAHSHPRSVWQRRRGKNVSPRGAGQGQAGQKMASGTPGTGGRARTGSPAPAREEDEEPF